MIYSTFYSFIPSYLALTVPPAPTPCRHMVSDLFQRPSGLLFTFPSRYLFTIGLLEYLVLPVSSGGFPQAIRVPGYLRIETKKTFYFHLQGYHLLGLSFPTHSINKKICNFSTINGTSLPCNPHLLLGKFRLSPLSLAATHGMHICLFSTWY